LAAIRVFALLAVPSEPAGSQILDLRAHNALKLRSGVGHAPHGTDVVHRNGLPGSDLLTGSHLYQNGGID
jgi:hypothetical protein